MSSTLAKESKQILPPKKAKKVTAENISIIFQKRNFNRTKNQIIQKKTHQIPSL